MRMKEHLSSAALHDMMQACMHKEGRKCPMLVCGAQMSS